MTKAAELLSELNIDPGLGMDITTEDELGQPWDFSKQHMKDKARHRFRQQKPDLLVGSFILAETQQGQGHQGIPSKVERSQDTHGVRV